MPQGCSAPGAPPAPPVSAAPPAPTAASQRTARIRRLRSVWRSAGWPLRDTLEAELLAQGLLQGSVSATGHETVSLTAEGLALLARATDGHRQARDAHEALVQRVAGVLQREGRLVWTELSLRAGLAAPPAPLPAAQSVAWPAGDEGAGPARPALRWVVVRPDLFSLRPSTQEAGLMPLAHEVKAHRSDLLSDLRRPDKAAAYQALAGACWYVLGEGVGDADDVPAPYGVMVEQAGRLQAQRAPERREARLDLATWLALARATPQAPQDGAWQPMLGAPPDPLPGALPGTR